MKKVILIFFFIFFSFSIFGNMVIHSTSNNNPGGAFGKTESVIVFFAKIPTNAIYIDE